MTPGPGFELCSAMKYIIIMVSHLYLKKSTCIVIGSMNNTLLKLFWGIGILVSNYLGEFGVIWCYEFAADTHIY